MAIPLIVDSTDALPEAVRGLYVKNDEGKFRLDLSDDVIPAADVAGLKSALTAERTTVKTQKTQLGSLAPLLTIIGDKSPDDIRAALEFAADPANKNGGGKAKADFDNLIRQKQTEWDGKEKTLAGERDTAFSVARKAVVDAGLTSALSKAKATPEGLSGLPMILASRIKLEFADGKESLEILQADGKTPMAGSGANISATFDDLVKEAIKTYPSLFAGTGVGGSGTPPKQHGTAGAKQLTRSEFDALEPSDRMTKMREGFKVVD